MFSSADFRIHTPHVCPISLGNHLHAHRWHSIALVVARLLATGWSTYALWRTMNIQTRMQHLIEGPDSPCQLNMLGPYFTRRFSLQVCFAMLCPLHRPSIRFPRLRTWSYIGMPSSFPFTSPGVSTKYASVSPRFRAYLFTHLCQMYRTHTFRRVGPPKDVLRMYAVRV